MQTGSQIGRDVRGVGRRCYGVGTYGVACRVGDNLGYLGRVGGVGSQLGGTYGQRAVGAAATVLKAPRKGAFTTNLGKSKRVYASLWRPRDRPLWVWRQRQKPRKHTCQRHSATCINLKHLSHTSTTMITTADNTQHADSSKAGLQQQLQLVASSCS